MNRFVFAVALVAACRTEAPTAEPAAAAQADVAHWTCPMHTSIQQPRAGQCPICGMDLVAVTKKALESGEVVVDATRRTRFGIVTEPAKKGPLDLEVRAVGRIAYDERRLHDLTARVQGWVDEVGVGQVGDAVEKGQPIVVITSPELIAVQQELLIAAAGGGTGLVEEARQRLHLFGMDDRQIDRVIQAGKATENVTLRSPAKGIVIEKYVVGGDEVTPGMRLFRIGDLGAVWVEADVYEGDVPLVKVGMPAHIEVAGIGTEVEGEVDFVRPLLDPKTRTIQVRIELENPSLDLLPNMFATVHLRADAGERLTVPESAVIYAGDRRIVFVEAGTDRLLPREVETGLRGNGRVEITKGIEEGELVVKTGVFLVAAESRLKSATGQLGGGADETP